MNLSRKKRYIGNTLLRSACAAMAAVFLAAGCGSGKPVSTGSSLSDPPAPSQYNNYAGTQSYQLAGDGYHETGGVWDLTLDDVNQFFTYTDISVPPVTNGGGLPPYPLEGNTKAASSFLKLTLTGQNAGNGGYVLEIPGRQAIFRPGNDSSLVVIAPAASTSACQGLSQKTTFEFLTLWLPYNTMAPQYAAWGSIDASSSGNSWSFSNLQMYTQDGTALNPQTPSSGVCAYTKEGYVTTIPPQKATGNLPWTVVVGPSGYLAIDQGQGNSGFDIPPSYTPTGPLGLAGFPEPSSQIDTNSLAGGNYIGFVYNVYAGNVGHPVTQPVAFTGGSGTIAIGGLYPNDDPTQTPPANITLNLGQQDSGTNGLYKSVTITIPDTYNGCADESYGGMDANGNPTCILYGTAIAGQVEGKYVLYVTVLDRSLETIGITGAALDYFLYQQ